MNLGDSRVLGSAKLRANRRVQRSFFCIFLVHCYRRRQIYCFVVSRMLSLCADMWQGFIIDQEFEFLQFAL